MTNDDKNKIIRKYWVQIYYKSIINFAVLIIGIMAFIIAAYLTVEKFGWDAFTIVMLFMFSSNIENDIKRRNNK